MDIAILAYDGMTALDAVGPAQVLAALPRARVRWVARQPGPKQTDCGMAVVAEDRLEDVPAPGIIVVPGALDVRPVLRDEPVLAWIRAVHAVSRWTTSVCTGALILGAAGVLKGLPATTHWAMLEHLRRYGAEPQLERVVEHGKVITAAGVSAGIDMALVLAARVAGERVARTIQLSIEYDPQPPFEGGSLRSAPPDIVTAARRALGVAAPD